MRRYLFLIATVLVFVGVFVVSYYFSGATVAEASHACVMPSGTVYAPFSFDFHWTAGYYCDDSGWCGDIGSGSSNQTNIALGNHWGSGPCPWNYTVENPPPVPSAPTNLASSPGVNSVVSWSSVSGATYYQLRVDDQTANGWNGGCNGSQNSGDICENISGTSKTFTATAGNSYSWWVHACNTSGCSSPASSSFTLSIPTLSWHGTPNYDANGNITLIAGSADYVFDLRANQPINAIKYGENKWGDGQTYNGGAEIPTNSSADKIISSDTPVGTNGVGVFDCDNGLQACLGNIDWSAGREWAGVSVGTPPITNIPLGTYSRNVYMRSTAGIWSSPVYNTFRISPTCTVPTVGGTFTAPYSFSFNIPDGNYWGNNAGVSYSQIYLKSDGTVKYPNDVPDTIKNSFNQPFGAGNYVGNLNNFGNNSLCRWDFTVTQAPSYTHYTTGQFGDCTGYNVYTGEGGTQTRTVTPYTNTTPPNESQPDSSQSCSVGTYTHYTIGSWSACAGYNTSTGQGGAQTRTVSSYTNTTGPSDSQPASSQSCSVPSYTHYNESSWSACTGYNTSTGQGGGQTRAVTSYTDTTSPDDTEPSSSQSCSMPPDFNFLSAPGSGTLSNVYSTFVTFIGGQQSALSVPVMIAVDPTFPSYPTPANLAFSVTSVSPELPSGVSYAFTPNPLSPSGYSQGTSFVITVPVTNAGLYTLTVEASGGGIVKQATVYLNVNVANPTFQEI